MSQLLRQYEAWECGEDGYPRAWHHSTAYGSYPAGHTLANPPIKDLIRMEADHRCLRCLHPYPPGITKMHPRGEWTPCSKYCQHRDPLRILVEGEWMETVYGVDDAGQLVRMGKTVESRWRILTVHHLDEDKANCRWFNLAALCQRCHLRMQRAVVMGRPYHYAHSEWFKPFAAGFYAWKYLGEDLERGETIERLPELLALEHRFTQEVLL